MLLSFLTFSGTIYTAYEAFHQDDADRQTLVLSAAAGLISSLFLQALARTFSKKEQLSWHGKIFSRLVNGFSSVLSGVVLPLGIATGYLQKAGEFVNQHSYGTIQVEQRFKIGNWEIQQLYPIFVGGNFGFMAGQSFAAVYSFFKSS